jgi:Ca2+-binding EF-hand superfamily protein
MWGQIDDDGNKKLSYDEFKNCIIDHNIDLNRDEAAELFKMFDQDGSGQIDFNEFLLEIRVFCANFFFLSKLVILIFFF